MLFLSIFGVGCYKTLEYEYYGCVHIFFPPSRDPVKSSTASHIFIDLKKLSNSEKIDDKSVFIQNSGSEIEVYSGKSISSLIGQIEDLTGPSERSSYGPSYHPSRALNAEQREVHLYSNETFSFYTDTEGNLISVNFWTSGPSSVDSLSIFGKKLTFPSFKSSVVDLFGEADEEFEYYTQ